ncbi:hypothetical protein BEP19_02130 [Ammoniphilus oxalaticus]|uniref:Yip1 domain-containing protein n=1 Tax=Ammoniphilus oxalaticus TaxID=66863 RepID=A0A419SNE0_9BACL|nr:hypothetical protein [Ammoniphilus oxalaticus]RKD25762.1 hypothetical protein BEP19_02130 [Ammoniphilus oxalaticus]
MIVILFRKIITASIAGSLFAILLGIIRPSPFGEPITSLSNYLFSVVSITLIYLMYSFPVIFIYGTLTSIISDKLGAVVSTKLENDRYEHIISGVFHLLFGLVLLYVSLGASILFFITDRILLKNKNNYRLSHAMKSLAIPITVWLICMGIVYIENIFF